MKKLSALLILLSLLLSGSPVSHAQRVDSLTVFKPVQLAAPVALIGAGLAGYALGEPEYGLGLNERLKALRGDSKTDIDDFIQYIPLAAVAGLDWVGVDAKHGFVDRVIVSGVSFVSMSALVHAFKWTCHEERPDHSAFNSFPSGHTATAFFASEIIRREYGWQWGTAAYALSAGVGAMRMYKNRHWLCDVVAGAGFGILGANIGYWVLPSAKRVLGLDRQDKQQLSLSPMYDPMTGAAGATLAIVF